MPEAKKYRFLADVLNDLAVVVDVFNPVFSAILFPGARVIGLCTSAALRAVCGVLAGGAKAAITLHFATPRDGVGDVGDLNAKDSSKETILALLGMLVRQSTTVCFDSDIVPAGERHYSIHHIALGNISSFISHYLRSSGHQLCRCKGTCNPESEQTTCSHCLVVVSIPRGNPAISPSSCRSWTHLRAAWNHSWPCNGPCYWEVPCWHHASRRHEGLCTLEGLSRYIPGRQIHRLLRSEDPTSSKRNWEPSDRSRLSQRRLHADRWVEGLDSCSRDMSFSRLESRSEWQRLRNLRTEIYTLDFSRCQGQVWPFCWPYEGSWLELWRISPRIWFRTKGRLIDHSTDIFDWHSNMTNVPIFRTYTPSTLVHLSNYGMRIRIRTTSTDYNWIAR